MNRGYLYIGGGVAALLVLFVLMYLFRPTATVTPVETGGVFGTGEGRAPVGGQEPTTPSSPPATSQARTDQKVFKLLEGPVAGAVLMQMGRPTTTIARFVMADSGRVFDLPLDVPGAVPRAVSNTTIPGIASVRWTAGDLAQGTVGAGAVLQYVDGTTVKTLHLAFPPATTTLTTQGAVRLKFLPDGIVSLAVSPDGKNLAYLLKVGSGSDGYRAAADGTAARKLFSLPLSQILLSWPSAGTLLAQSTSAAGIPGVVFTVSATSGTTEPLLYAEGLTATADRSFSKVVYQTANANSRAVYARDVKSGLNTPLSFDPSPERCTWSATAAAVMYCANPLTFMAPNFLDLWYAGLASAADSIFAFNAATGATRILAAPGSGDGGEPSDIAAISVSADDRYLVFVRKGDRSLWGVRLTQ